LASLLKHDFDVIDCQKSSLFPLFPTKIHSVVRNSALVGMWTEIWGNYWYNYLGKKGLAGKAIERAAVQLPDVNIAISEFVANQMRDIGRTDGISVVHNGVDYDRIRDIKPADTGWDVLYAGRLSQHKNIDVLIDAVAAASDRLGEDIDCGIIGDGPERERLERYSRQSDLEVNIDFLGFLEEEVDVLANMKSASVFVLPSEREGFPNTILEANACGVPVITVNASKNGGRVIVKDGETGYVTDLASDAIANRIVEIMSDPDLRARLGDAAREYGAAHNWDAIVSQTEEVYLKTVR
jgi:glycosyltransferase involved in cell wall biosynthesis